MKIQECGFVSLVTGGGGYWNYTWF